VDAVNAGAQVLAAHAQLILAHAGGGHGGHPYVPPQPTVDRLLFSWSPELAPMLFVGFTGALYVLGVGRLAGRGDAWGPWRVAAFLAGLFVIAYALSGGVAVYDTTLFSAHAVQHMLLASLAPPLLALGAPVTLALRTLPRRGRAVLLAVLHSRVAKVLAFPAVGGAVFIGSLYGLYFTSIYEASLRHEWVHNLVHLHFLLAGCLFIWPIIGIDPLPGRLPHWARLLVLFVTFPLHALWALAVFSTNQIFGGDYYRELNRSWGSSLLNDQRTGAGLMWAAGELLGAVLFLAVFAQWRRADEREAVRRDRWLDRFDMPSPVSSPVQSAVASGTGPAVGTLDAVDAAAGDVATAPGEPAGGGPGANGTASGPQPAGAAGAGTAGRGPEAAYNDWLASLAAPAEKQAREEAIRAGRAGVRERSPYKPRRS
jgi:putative copper resistance protein D